LRNEWLAAATPEISALKRKMREENDEQVKKNRSLLSQTSAPPYRHLIRARFDFGIYFTSDWLDFNAHRINDAANPVTRVIAVGMLYGHRRRQIVGRFRLIGGIAPGAYELQLAVLFVPAIISSHYG
jgi:hypothetical protein